jgi:D-alanyl-lipoteichoic acid acyltransferase DltB (MBOAT superfamily)
MNAMMLAGTGAVLIGMCHLPIAFGWRLALVSVAGTLLVLGRAAWLPMPAYEVIWPILGSMFMFRLIIYLYDLRNGSAPFDVWRSLAYFFMLPNVCFPMYPLVDYQTFNRTYFNEASPWRMYQVGIKWIFRGMMHLLLYRFILQNAIIGADYVTNAADLVRYMVTTFLLYLQISGQFHIIIGLLHLFGFNLPETHHNYLLSSSFTDFWRRINIYWKDFIQKIFFNPIYFRAKQWGPATAMIVATLVAFFFTWLLHSYQWFWIRGTFLITWQDTVFWSLLAFLVLGNVLYEQRYGRKRLIKGKPRTLGSRVALGLRTAATFSMIVTLWCMWTFQGSFGEWLEFMGNIARIDASTALMIAAGLAGLGLAGAWYGDSEREYSAGQKPKKGPAAEEVDFGFWRSAALATMCIVLVPAVVKFRNDLPVGATLRNVLADIRRDQSLHVRAERDQGYYEDLTNTKSYNLALWELYNRRPTNWVLSIGQTDAGRAVPDKFHQFELAPSKRVDFMNQQVSTNRWGMRDRDYEKQKPPGTIRVALLGSSITMGWGVADDESYENIVEDRLNRQYGGEQRFELLNFSVAGFSAFQNLWSFERALEFEPDVIIWEMHATAPTWMVNHLTRVLRKKVPIPYPKLQEMLEESGINPRMSGLALRSRLREISPELMNWIWDRMQRECDARGIELEVVLLPRADSMRADNENLSAMGDLARDAGLPVLDLRRAFRSVADRSTIATAPGDAHPNAEGHQLLAEELYDEMLDQPYWQKVLGERRDATTRASE